MRPAAALLVALVRRGSMVRRLDSEASRRVEEEECSGAESACLSCRLDSELLRGPSTPS